MGPGAEARITWWTLVGLLMLALAVALAAAPLALRVEPQWRPLVVRGAVVLWCGCALWRLARAVAWAARLDEVSAAEQALQPASPEARPDPSLPNLASEIRSALRPRLHPDQRLWARLQALAARRGVILPPNALRPRAGRRATRAKVERLLATLEDAR